MALNIVAIREAIAAVVESAVSNSEHPANVYAYPTDSPALPAIMLLPAPFDDGAYVNYWGTFSRSVCAIGLRLELRVPGNDIDSARVLDVYLSELIPDVIDGLLGAAADPTLGGLCESVLPRSGAVPARFAAADDLNRTWLSSSVALEVQARRS